MNKKASGFTIIELIVVIALLGILSAVALPRFINVTDDAHTAAVSGAGAGFATGVALIRAQAIAEATASGAEVSGFGDGTMFVNASEAPMSSTNSNTLDCVEVWEGLLQTNAPTVSGADSDYTTSESVADIECTYTYSTPNSDGNDRTIIYNSNSRAVNVNADGES
ncbi:MAG: prepilin-type N-terminal cleavage/methylation domain-containing protein [Motiliproteus sp.]